MEKEVMFETGFTEGLCSAKGQLPHLLLSDISASIFSVLKTFFCFIFVFVQHEAFL
jgi:hypothetical protein